MRICVLMIALLTSEAALANGGGLGPHSQASVQIRVSVAPRVWQTSRLEDSGRLCVAVGRKFAILDDRTLDQVAWVKTHNGCGFGGSEVVLSPFFEQSTKAIIISPE
jgi:hypothetical protein